MKLALLVLNKEELLETLLEGFIEIGVSGATIFDSIGMGHILSSDVPIFAGLRFMFAGSRPLNKTLISVISIGFDPKICIPQDMTDHIKQRVRLPKQ